MEEEEEEDRAEVCTEQSSESTDVQRSLHRWSQSELTLEPDTLPGRVMTVIAVNTENQYLQSS